ncbi:hypothetical protein KC973_03665 [Candidatus Saccharibacteria bacterium]|nr:hypothetical protein [Candidatus Saccharibacteria bacterium]
MAVEDFEVLPEFELGACATCPNAIHLQKAVEVAEDAANTVAERAMDIPKDILETGLGDLFTNIDKLNGGDVTGSIRFMGQHIHSVEEFQAALQTLASNSVEQHDVDVENKKEQLQELLDRCGNGPLKMRASKAGHQVVVTVCVSDAVPSGEACEHVHTQRDMS